MRASDNGMYVCMYVCMSSPALVSISSPSLTLCMILICLNKSLFSLTSRSRGKKMLNVKYILSIVCEQKSVVIQTRDFC